MNGREIATVIWLAVFVITALSIRDVRRAVPGLAIAVLPLAVPLLALAAWIAGLVILGHRQGLWIPALAYDTVVWMSTALILFGGAVHVFGKGKSIRGLIASVLGVAVVLEFYVNLYAASVWVELAVVPWTAFWATMATFAAHKQELRPAKKLADGALIATGVAALVYVSVRAGTGWGEIDWGEAWRKLALPFWLTLGMLPFVVMLGVYSAYSSAFSGVRRATKDRRRRWRARLALASRLHVRAREVSAFDFSWCSQLVEASSLREARAVVVRFRRRPRTS